METTLSDVIITGKLFTNQDFYTLIYYRPLPPSNLQ